MTERRSPKYLVYWCAALYFLTRAAYDGFYRHSAVSAYGDILAAFLAVFFFWYGTYLWNSWLRVIYLRRKNGTDTKK
jgi:hypothetical protein